MSAVEEIQAAIGRLTKLKAGSTQGPFFKEDSEGEIRVFPERLLRNVGRDEDGDITSWRSPGSWGTDEMVFEYEVESWDEGEDPQDDRMRANAEMFVTLHRTIDAQLAILTHARDAWNSWPKGDIDPDVVALARAINGGTQ